MEQNWLTVEEKHGLRMVMKCAKEAEGEIVIPNGVKGIAKGAFEGCDKITSLVLPEGLRYINSRAFCSNSRRSYCPSLASIYFPSNNALSPERFDLLMNSLFVGTAWYEKQPKGVVYAGVNVIGYKGGMLKNTEVVIKEGTKYISGNAFYNCKNLVKLVLPKSLVYCDSMTFYGCSSLETIVFSSNVELLGLAQESLKQTKWYEKQPKGVVYAGANAIGYKGYMPDWETEIVIKEGTKYIAKGAFCMMDNLERVTLPQSIVSIGLDAFSYSQNLKTISFPESCSVETICFSTFRDDKDFSKLLFEGGLQETEWETHGRLIKRKLSSQ